MAENNEQGFVDDAKAEIDEMVGQVTRRRWLPRPVWDHFAAFVWMYKQTREAYRLRERVRLWAHAVAQANAVLVSSLSQISMGGSGAAMSEHTRMGLYGGWGHWVTAVLTQTGIDPLARYTPAWRDVFTHTRQFLMYHSIVLAWAVMPYRMTNDEPFRFHRSTARLMRECGGQAVDEIEAIGRLTIQAILPMTAEVMQTLSMMGQAFREGVQNGTIRLGESLRDLILNSISEAELQVVESLDGMPNVSVRHVKPSEDADKDITRRHMAALANAVHSKVIHQEQMVSAANEGRLTSLAVGLDDWPIWEAMTDDEVEKRIAESGIRIEQIFGSAGLDGSQ